MSNEQKDGKERRVNEVLQSFWDTLRGEDAVPAEKDLDVALIDDIWDSCFMVEISHGDAKREYKYSYVGESIVEAYGDDLKGKEVYNQLMGTHTRHLLMKFETVVRSMQSVTDENEFRNLEGQMIKYRQCLVPFADSADKLSFILGSMTWRRYSHQELEAQVEDGDE